MVKCLLNVNKMLVETVANLEEQVSKKIKEEVQVQNDIRVIGWNFFVLKVPNHISFHCKSIIMQ